MRVILVQIGSILKYPPTLSVLNVLVEKNYEVVLCSTDIPEEIIQFCEENNVTVINLKVNYENSKSTLSKLVNLAHIRKIIWKEIDKIYDKSTVIWVFSNIALKHLGHRLLDRNYILHFYELFEQVLYSSKFKFLKMDVKKYCKAAKKVVVSEYNRAHITKTWMELNELPEILPNKPYFNNSPKINHNIIASSEAMDLLEKLKNKKIILYQGILDQERPLGEFISAVNELGDEYALIIMSGSENVYSNIESDNYYFLPFIPPPYHLEVTKRAFIGILSYVPNMDGYSSPLNAIYCAPNKIYEYARFGIPMIGNSIPGLHYTLETNKFGVCVHQLCKKEIIEAIRNIESNHTEYSNNALKYYDSTDINTIISNILDIDIK